MIGTILDGRYRILRRLGAGGMGEVYLGEHLLLNRKEAVKVLKSRLARDRGHMARFRREARATNRVQHPNIVSFYDFGKLTDGRLYLTMEFADGPNLERVLRAEGRLDPGRAVSILRQLALAIHFAHSKDVIHRDLKPQNLVLVQEPGRPDMLKVLDFGVAKITDPDYMESVAITKEGQLFGTPGYTAPEQIRGVRDDPRTDVYAMGCIAYELLTGETPFTGRPMAVLEAHMSEPPLPPSQRSIEAMIPLELDEIILQCLAKDPELRLQSGLLVAERLAALRLDPGTGFVGRGLGGAALNEFEADTQEGGPTNITIVDDEKITDVFSSRYDLELRRIQRALAESMCDLGCSDPRLLVLLAVANQVEQELYAVHAELGQLARSDELVAQKGREREASLRFALGELHFGYNDESNAVDLMDQAIAALTQRLENAAEELRIQHASITEKQIDRTAQRAIKYEELRALDQQLGLLIELHAEKMHHSPAIAELLEERQRVIKLLALQAESGKTQ